MVSEELINAEFRADFFGEETFSGFTNGETWNGWACPYFSYEQGQRIITVYREKLKGKAWYEEEEDMFFFEFSEETEEYPAELVNGRKLYPIGNGVWIWEESE
jgi:hypothetical protein